MYAVKYTGLLEKRGRPGVPIIFDNLIEDAKITSDEIGMRVRWVAVPYPPEKISETGMTEIMNKVVDSLTSPLSQEETKTGIYKPPIPEKIAFKGTFEKIRKFIDPILRGKPMGEYKWPKHYLWLSDDAVVPVYPQEGVQAIVVGEEQNPMMQGWKTGYPTIVSIDKWR
jgi:hypothetical protein